MSEYIEVPVTIGFDMRKIVGTLKILKEALPSDVDWCFSLGYEVTDAFYDNDSNLVVNKYKLKTIGLIPDIKYPGVKNVPNK